MSLYPSSPVLSALHTKSVSSAFTAPAKTERRPRSAETFTPVDIETMSAREAFVDKIVGAALSGKPITGSATLELELDRLRKFALEVFDRRHGLTTEETKVEREHREKAEAHKKAVDALVARRAAAERDSRLAIDRLKIKIPRGRDEPLGNYKTRLGEDYRKINQLRFDAGLGTGVPDEWLLGD
jgi:hypothetical protein